MTQAHEKTQSSTPQMPSEVLHYMKGATEECLQFDFLIGAWSVDGSRFSANGELQQKFSGTWRAEYLHDKRIVMDDFAVCLSSGQEVSSFITLRTYSPITARWEMSGIAAFQPAMKGKWYGNVVGGEMQTLAEGTAPDGRMFKNQIRFYDIEKNRFKWESCISHDDGETWIKVSSLVVNRI